MTHNPLPHVAVLLGLILVVALAPLTAHASRDSHDVALIRRSEVYAIENSGSASVLIEREQHGRETATVDAATVEGGTATPGEDYTPTRRTISLEPVDEREFEVPLENDLVSEPLETFGVELSNPTGTMGLSAFRRATVTIVDDDGVARISLATATATVYENAATVTLVLIRSGSAEHTATVNYATAAGSAQAGSDFTSTSGTVTFEPDQRLKLSTLKVPILDDEASEEDETFVVTLSDPTGATLEAPDSVTVTILDDENPSSDTAPPVSYFHQPLHGETYRSRDIRDILAFAEDVGVGVKKVEIALRSQLDTGRCRWLDKKQKRFVPGRCDDRRWMSFRVSETVVYELPRKLRPSRGTNIAFYKAWSRGIDEVGNVERAFESDRNVSRFEVR